MICAYCKTVRAENAEPCANCGAPSPIQATPQSINWDIPEYGRSGGLLSNQSALSGQWSQQAQQLPLQQPVDTPVQAGGAYLPVPFGGNAGLQIAAQPNGMQVMPAPAAQDITIAPPSYDESVVYVPPMYTKPRPIIPRYRIISGFLSVIIVSLMLCGGLGYYAKASGKLDLVTRVLTGNKPAPPNLRSTAPSLPDPQNNVVIGNPAAYNVIPSATTTKHLINGTVAAQTDKIFKPNEPFYLTYSVHPTQQGSVTIKWYMNNMNLPYSTVAGKTLPANQAVTGVVPMVYASQAEGKVELYWNDQLAQTLFFVVRN